MFMYTESNNGNLPKYDGLLTPGNATWKVHGKWQDGFFVLQNPGRNLVDWVHYDDTLGRPKSIFACPSSLTSGAKEFEGARHYGMNGAHGNTATWYRAEIKAAKIKYPGGRLMFSDIEKTGSWASLDVENANGIFNFTEGRFLRHSNNSAANVCYADGHAGSVKREAIPASNSTAEGKAFWRDW
ncbi:hypothetical protein SDC9_186741 [bioreactor metagenome]|uniref:Uncharacterized protein n=1 Tax=bioreactor metagenome TaxID=1076179 RepID=A0A645HV14_9ZZZZ